MCATMWRWTLRRNEPTVGREPFEDAAWLDAQMPLGRAFGAAMDTATLATWQAAPPRRMTPLDLPRVCAVESQIYPFPWTEGNFRDALHAGHEGWLFERFAPQPELLAYLLVMWVIEEVHLLNLSVAAPWQGQGLGSAVLRWLLLDCAERGAQSVLLEVRPSNLVALHLYGRFGFQHVGTRKAYYPAAGSLREDAQVLRVKLPLTLTRGSA